MAVQFASWHGVMWVGHNACVGMLWWLHKCPMPCCDVCHCAIASRHGVIYGRSCINTCMGVVEHVGMLWWVHKYGCSCSDPPATHDACCEPTAAVGKRNGMLCAESTQGQPLCFGVVRWVGYDTPATCISRVRTLGPVVTLWCCAGPP